MCRKCSASLDDDPANNVKSKVKSANNTSTAEYHQASENTASKLEKWKCRKCRKKNPKTSNKCTYCQTNQDSSESGGKYFHSRSLSYSLNDNNCVKNEKMHQSNIR